MNRPYPLSDQENEIIETKSCDFVSVADCIASGIDIVDSDYKVIFQNKILLDRFGDIRGRLCYKEYMGRKRPCPDCPMKKAIESNRTEQAELTGSDGREYEIVSAPLIKGFNGKSAVVELVTDITDRKQEEQKLKRDRCRLENLVQRGARELVEINKQLKEDIVQRKLTVKALGESEKRYRGLFEESRDAIYIAAQSGKFIDVNKSALKLFGYTKKEMLKLNFYSLCANARDRKTLQRQIGLKGSVENFSIQLQKKNGKKMHCLLSANMQRMYNTRSRACQFIIHDITTQKQAEIKLKNSLEQSRRIIEGTIQAMAKAVEMRDPYTAGHQRRVTKLACIIARQMGLKPSQIEGVRVAGTLHDIGKIYVPAEILTRPRKLNEMEFSLVKEHPNVGYEILKNEEFPWPIAKIVQQHHERMDGSGYPCGLYGKNIMLEARILAVADIVEAMASHRPYRPALGIDKALEEISKNKGRLYDTVVVDICIGFFTQRKNGFNANSRRRL